jgi:oxygen-independent coproporphyrinogen-3 oxidase
VRHLYVHVPFCARRCSYCDFAIAVRRVVPSDRFVDAILREYRRRGPAEGWAGTAFETVYLGGGTPSRLSPDAVGRLLDAIQRTDDAEVTLEANPDDVVLPAARAWIAHGVNRVSLGVQSFDDRVLRWMHRMHDQRAARRAVETAREAGVASVSLDLIFGLPDELERDFPRDLAQALSLGVDHLSIYGLTLEPRTPYARWAARGATEPATDERYEREFLLAHETVVAAGFEHYEISNYARVGPAGGGSRSRHNAVYWTGASYVGLGPSAHGFDGSSRRWNLRDWAAYERAVSRGDDPVAGSEALAPEQRSLEAVYLGLRTAEGLSEGLSGRLNPRRLLAAIRRGWLIRRGNSLACTPRGWLVLDELVAGLTTSPEGG